MTTRVALLAAVLLVAIAPQALAATLVYGIVQDENYRPVNGGDVWLERKWGQNWLIAPCCEKHPMEGHAFQFDVPQPGRYRVLYAKRGCTVEWIRYEEFDLASPPTTDIQINVKCAVVPAATATPEATVTPWPTLPVPTTLYPPTVDPTATATPTPSGWTAPYAVISWYGNWSYGTDARAMPYSRKSQAPGPGFMQISETWQWSIIDKARRMQGAPLESLLDVRDDPRWLAGASMGLGSQETPGFDVGPYMAMGFSQAIVARER